MAVETRSLTATGNDEEEEFNVYTLCPHNADDQNEQMLKSLRTLEKLSSTRIKIAF
jgi:hypothetical protein